MSTTIIRRKPLAIQVCSDEKDMHLLTAEVNEIEPSGTENGWQLEEDPKNPNGGTDPTKVACNDGGGKYHYVFTC